jgi:hypothetical protein
MLGSLGRARPNQSNPLWTHPLDDSPTKSSEDGLRETIDSLSKRLESIEKRLSKIEGVLKKNGL